MRIVSPMVLNTVMLLGVLTGILLAVGFVLGGLAGMTMALVIAFAINLFSYWYSDTIVLRIYRAVPSRDKELNSLVEDLARQAKIPKPRVYTMPTDVPNAFATGRNPQHAAIAVTRGLLGLEKDELRGVLAHEIGHIKNRDILVSTMAATIAGAISYLAQMGYWSLFLSGTEDRREGSSMLGLIVIIIFAPLAALLVRFAISRKREYKADITGAVLIKRPQALASALQKISAMAKEHPLRGPSASSHLWIVNPFKADWFTHLFSTHPPLEERIHRLEQMEVRENHG